MEEIQLYRFKFNGGINKRLELCHLSLMDQNEQVTLFSVHKLI